MNELTIGRAATEAGVKISTIRYYERRGLIDRPPQPDKGFRTYPESTIRRICFIRRAQELGFTLQETGELLSLEGAQGAHCGDVKERAFRKRNDVENKIEQLQTIRSALDELIEACPGEGALRQCNIMGAFYDEQRATYVTKEKEE